VGYECGKDAVFPRPVDEIPQRAARGTSIPVYTVFQRQLKRAETLHFADNEQVIVEKGKASGEGRLAW
jgi:hypothetical protein